MAFEGFDVICPSCRGAVPSFADTCAHCGQAMFGPPPPPKGTMSYSTPALAPEAAWPAPPPRVSIDLGTPSRSYGGFWIRVGACLIDTMILLVSGFVLHRTLGPNSAILAWIVEWLYFAVMESSVNQATIGKMVCGLAVTDTDGNRISFGRATGRYLGKIVSTLTLGLGFLMVGWTREKRGLHDFIAGTLVVRA